MIIIYGTKNEITDNSDIIQINESQLNIPFGHEAYDKPLRALNEISKAKINDMKIPVLFQYDDISLWWFVYTSIFPAMKRSFNFIEKFIEMIDEKKPNIIKVVGEFDKLQLIRQICNKKNIKFQYAKTDYISYLIKKELKHTIQPRRFWYVTRKKHKKRLNLFLAKSREIPSLGNKILFAIPTVYRRLIYDPSKGETVKGEFIQGRIIEMLKTKNFDIVGLDMDYTFRGNPEILIERLSESIPWFPLEIIMESYSKDINYNNFLKKYNNIITNHHFRNLFSFNGVNFWDLMEEDFVKLSYFPHLPTYIQLIEGFEKFFTINKPKAVFIPYETGPLALPIIIACKKNHIKTIGIQHGITYHNNPDYSHDDFLSDDNAMGMPIPDFNLLFGDFVKKLLTEEGKYPKEKLVVFGNPEFFNINKILVTLNSRDLRKKYDLPKDANVILFTSSKIQKYYKVYGNMDYDERVWQYLLNEFGNDEKFFLVLKPHPAENTDVYEKALKNGCFNNAKIIEGDLFELISVSFVVISIISTTILDSICLKKPVIRVKFMNSRPILPYDEYGVVISTELEDLSTNIHKIIEDDAIRKKLIARSDEFLKDHYNIPEDDPLTILETIINN